MAQMSQMIHSSFSVSLPIFYIEPTISYTLVYKLQYKKRTHSHFFFESDCEIPYTHLMSNIPATEKRTETNLLP